MQLQQTENSISEKLGKGSGGGRGSSTQHQVSLSICSQQFVILSYVAEYHATKTEQVHVVRKLGKIISSREGSIRNHLLVFISAAVGENYMYE